MIPMKPPFSGPIRLVAGTRTSLKWIAAVSLHRQPILSSLVRSTPGLSMSISSNEMPAAPGPPVHRAGKPVGAHARGDEHLAAVDHIVIAIPDRGRLEVRDVAAAARLGDAERY